MTQPIVRIFLLILLVNISFSNSDVLAEDIRVLVRIGSSAEAKASKITFAQELSKLVYREIMNGNVTLWDSREKGLQITPVTLRGIENTTETKFEEQEYVFSYELWSRNRKMLTSKIYGFTFSSKTEEGEEVSYGYVDYDDLSQVFMTSRVPTNVDGDFNTTFATAFYRKLFDYSIFQFGNQIVNGWVESERLKHQFKDGREFNDHIGEYVSREKMVSYVVDGISQFDDEKSRNSELFLSSVENFLNSNREVFFNLGGDKMINYIEKEKIEVSKIQINELWVKKNNFVIFKPKSMIIYVGDEKLNRIPLTDMRKLKLDIGATDLVTFLKTKNFNFSINQINAEPVEQKVAYIYYKALLNSEWTTISQYVAKY